MLGRSDAKAGPAGLRLVIAYKLAKAAAELGLALLFVVLLIAGLGVEVHQIALHLRQHVVGAWGVRLADLLLRDTTPGRLYFAAALLGMDGVLSYVEGWSLKSRRAWGPWLVVLATASLVPLEVYEILRHFRITRLLVLVANLAIVAYLVWHRSRAAAAAPDDHRMGEAPSPRA
ncbi:MAG TPA: DUF2127 domain-containing protein [Anaeromyxobacteraceae bacterium]|nr:DUF2127 domain-containing protein [Anaeromyxobacteraceae bacterium]